MSCSDLSTRWNRLMDVEWQILASVGQPGWESVFVAYLAEKDSLLRETPFHQLPADLLKRLAVRQRRLKDQLAGSVHRRRGLYDKESAARR